jgi:D-alanyl-lipoteichoic acid acyltransferase DltB (MBOAT superfamily)
MLFNSISFLIFLPIVYGLYWWIQSWENFKHTISVQNILLLIASYFFYAYWNIWFLVLLIFSTSLDYFSGLKIENSATNQHKKIWFWLSICINLGLLGLFKYFNFISINLNELLGNFGWTYQPMLLLIALPIGISFYTFHGLSYVIDIYHDKIKAEKNILNYSLFVCFFPLLVAGPIERAQHLIPQLVQRKVFNRAKTINGLQQMLWGFFKKIVIADNCAVFVNQIFSDYENLNSSSLFIGAIFFSFQIYGDFSGYTDIALGAARLFGIELFNNFSYPYFSKSINEFWKRWHISLTSWFRDYIYIPMGGNRVNPIRKIINTIVVFLISGFWHGANWTYISWGFLNSIFILPKTLSQKTQSIDSNKIANKVIGAIKMLLTFLTVSILWVFFRSKTVYDASKYLQNLVFKWNSILPDFNGRKNALVLSFIIFVFMIFEWIGKSHNCPLVFTNSFKNKWLKWGFYYAIIFSILYFYRGNDQFIYFQF